MLSVFGGNLSIIEDQYYLNVMANEPVVFVANGTDDGEVRYNLVQNSANASLGEKNADGTANVTMTVTETNQTVNIRLFFILFLGNNFFIYI